MENDPQEGEKTDSESTSLMVDLNKVLGTFDSELAINSSFSVIPHTYH